MRIENTRGCTITLPGSRPGEVLRPGVNEVDYARWDAVKDNKAVQMYLASGHLRLLAESTAETVTED